MKKAIVASILIVLAGPLHAQERGYIDVSGQAELTTQASSMQMMIIIEGQGQQALEAQQDVLTRSQKVMQYLQEKSFVSEVVTETLKLNYQHYSEREPRFQARQHITLTVNDLDKYNAFIVELINAGVTQYHTMGFSIENEELYNKGLIAEAFQNARAKAELMAAQAGKKVGEAVIISDQPNFDNQPGLTADALKSHASGRAMGETIIRLQQVVYVRFLLE